MPNARCWYTMATAVHGISIRATPASFQVLQGQALSVWTVAATNCVTAVLPGARNGVGFFALSSPAPDF